MQITSAQAQKILTGNQKFSMLGFSMLITRMKGVYSRNSSPATLQSCVDEFNIFLQKYASIMQADIAIISKI